MTSELLYPLVGFGASLLAGVSGVGSGSLVAPTLIFTGVAPPTAVATDLAYAAVAKAVAAGYHWLPWCPSGQDRVTAGPALPRGEKVPGPQLWPSAWALALSLA